MDSLVKFLPSIVSLLSAVALFAFVDASKYHEDADKVFHFYSRPDIKAPKWDVRIYHESLISKGHWFVAPYETLLPPSENNGYGWVGPHIYDDTGELVWSGTGEFDGANVVDFRMHNVNGKDMMTLIDRDQGTGIIVDNHYEVQKYVQMEAYQGGINMHEFHFVDNGTRVLFLKNHGKPAPVDELRAFGLEDGSCRAFYHSIMELDATTWEQTFSWDMFGHIRLDESTYLPGTPQEICSRRFFGYDFVHSNSVDKNSDGDYILSGRHTNTLYKISGTNGTILWRLEGLMGKSDFEMVNDFRFSRQHNVRWRGRNETHSFISFLDNAASEAAGDKQPPSASNSRGMYIALDERNMVATLEHIYEHPGGPGSYARKRGNLEVLPNGNVFMGWSGLGRHSEHTPDGKLIMEAAMQPQWLGSYRNYKYTDFIGLPSTLPTLYSAAYGAANDMTNTQVYVSWNGATEVASWRLYKTSSNGALMERLVHVNRTGFETLLRHPGYSSYVYVEAVDRHGNVLGNTQVHKTITHPNVSSLAIMQEQKWLEQKDADLAPIIFGNTTSMFVIGSIVGALMLGLLLAVKAFAPVMLRRVRYKRVPSQEERELGEFDLALSDDEESEEEECAFNDEKAPPAYHDHDNAAG